MHRDHLSILLGVRDALMVLAALERELLMIAIFLLLDKLLDELLSGHFLGVVEVLRFSFLLVADAGEEASDGCPRADIET